MSSSGIPVDAVAKNNLSASFSSSSSAVSCLRLRLVCGWTWTSMAVVPKGLYGRKHPAINCY